MGAQLHFSEGSFSDGLACSGYSAAGPTYNVVSDGFALVVRLLLVLPAGGGRAGGLLRARLLRGNGESFFDVDGRLVDDGTAVGLVVRGKRTLEGSYSSHS